MMLVMVIFDLCCVDQLSEWVQGLVLFLVSSQILLISHMLLYSYSTSLETFVFGVVWTYTRIVTYQISRLFKIFLGKDVDIFY